MNLEAQVLIMACHSAKDQGGGGSLPWRGLKSPGPPSAKTILMVRPFSSLPLKLRMALSAVGMSKNSINPKPRGFPVSRSVTILQRQGRGDGLE